ncbi:orotidine-5'-phosphate decarboxylase [Parvularcula dongshanensis]|uniref:Orotidine 5'-phosphate decarboxylase n=1 Tax=Parvularcula dongshanensis TaxID=1173995 RepID=A0A840HYQ4_9PROT|nr:orotidine-5'-phosphate decarboxylase [Parvularcula dongshanensis]
MTDPRLIVALDLPSVEEAETLIALLADAVSVYKVGYQLLPLGGYELARRLHARGKGVFVDAKLLDIGATVERGVRSIARNGADMVTVHADPDTIEGAAQGRGDAALDILAVTVLTSWDGEALRAHGIEGSVLDLVLRRAEMAAVHGADGVIASAGEARAIRERFGDTLKIVTPGIRPKGAAADDQKRITTPAEAIAAGADRLVVGRPIVQAADPVGAARDIVAEIRT